MANYFLNDDGSLTKSNKKKKKGNNYILNSDGTISLNSPVETTKKESTNLLRDGAGTVNEDGYTYTGKNYGDYWYQNYATDKDKKIYSKDGMYFVYHEGSKEYQNVDTINFMTTKELSEKEYNEAKKLGYTGSESTLTNVSDKLKLDTADLSSTEYTEYENDLLRQEKNKDKELAHKRQINYGGAGLKGAIGEIKTAFSNIGYKAEKEIIDPIKNFDDNYETGKLNNQLALEYYKKMQGEENNADELAKKVELYNSFNQDLLNNPGATGTAIQQLNTQVESVKNQGIAATLLGLGGTILGAITTKTPQGAMKGAKAGGAVGYVFGSIPYMYKLEAGNQFKTLTDMGVPDDVAKKYSKITGGVNAAIESGENIVDLFTFGRAGETTSAVSKEAVKDMIDEYGESQVKMWLKNKVGEETADAIVKGVKVAGVSYVQNIGSEALEEALQETTSITTERLATDEAGIEREATLKDDLGRILEAGTTAAISTVFTGPLTSLGGSIVTNSVNKIETKIASKKGKKITSSEINEVIRKNIEKENPNLTTEEVQQIQSETFKKLQDDGIEIADIQQEVENIDNQIETLEKQLIATEDDVEYERISNQIRVLEDKANQLEQQDIAPVQKNAQKTENIVQKERKTIVNPHDSNLENISNLEYNKIGDLNVGGFDRRGEGGIPSLQESGSKIETQTIQREGRKGEARSFSRQEYTQFEERAKSTRKTVLTETDENITTEVKERLGKEVVFFDEKNPEYKGGASLTDPNVIYVSDSLSDNGKKFVAYHETMESTITHNKDFYNKYLKSAIDDIINDPNFETTKAAFKDGDIDLDNASDFAIAKDILSDYFAEKNTGVKIPYEVNLTPETLEMLDYISELASREISKNATQDIAPVKTTNEQNTTLSQETDIAPIKQELADLTSELKDTIKNTKKELKSLKNEIKGVKTDINEVVEDFKAITEEELPYLEQQYEEDFKNIDDSYAPIKQEDTTPEAEDEITATKSLEDVRDFDEVGSRKIKAYQYENPEVRPYFQEMAQYMLGDLENSVKGERGYNDQLYYDTAGEQGFYGTTRQTTDDIAELLDSKYNYSYKDIRKGLEAIIEDHGAENIAVAKRIELALDKRLREGYTDVSGYEIPANEEYLRLMEAKEITDYYNNLPIDESMIPVEEDIAPVVNASNTKVKENIVPIRRNVDWDNVEDTSQGNQIAFNKEGETVEVISELEKKQQRAYKKLGSKEDYISNKAFELYNEVKDLKKGKRASYELGRVLDVAFANINELTAGMTETEAKEVKNTIWRDVTTSLLNVKAKPLSTVNKNSTIEAVIRQNISREYDFKKKDIADMKEEDLVTKTKKELRKELLIDENDFFINALDNAKNRSMALMNNTDTIRNTELVFGRENGRKINEIIFQKEIDNEADSIAWQNKERDEIKALGIKARSKESAAVQKYGEKQYVETNGEVVSYTDEDLVREFPNVETQEKIKKAAKVIRNKYDNYIDRANEVLTKLGFDPIPKRKDYMRHFQELNDVFSRYGIPFNAQSMTEHVLPTDINGLTENWSPQKNYFANTQRRTGLKTTYDAITGIDGYIGGIANLIYHTEDIQRGRAFEELIRETYGEDKGFENLDNLPEELQQARAEKIQDNHLSNYAAWVHEWTNNVAGKKSKVDRSVESIFGRRAFSFLDTANKQVGANLVGLNVSSSLTNLIAPVKAAAKTKKLAVLKGTADTIKNIFIKDNFMSKNKFLTARMGTDMLSKNAWGKMQDAGYIFMKGMDWFSSNQIVRSKYYELRAKGMSEQQAHSEAGKFAARIMSDRTKGAAPQIYNSKMLGLLTKFQQEVNNDLYSMFYDTYHESKENAKGNALKMAAGMTFTLGQLFAFTHLFSKAFEEIAGYPPTLDVIEILKTAFGWGEDEDEEKTTSERLKAAADKLVDGLPYVNILTGGGRIPVASGLPNLVGVATGGKDQYGNELTLEDELKKLLFLVPPTGGNQIKKTYEGLSMFDEDLPISGSYTDSGNLRFPVEDTIQNRIQAGLFGQWANENARDYFDNERQPLKENQIEEFLEMNIPYKEYREYRKELSEVNKIKADKDEDGKAISGTAAGKKAYKIMNGDYSKKEKERLLEGLSSETYRITTSDLNKLNNNEELYKYYFSLTTKGKSDFINAIKNYGFDAETLYEVNTVIKNIEDNYSKLNDNGTNLSKQKKQTIKDTISQYTTTKAQYDYLYYKIYKK